MPAPECKDWHDWLSKPDLHRRFDYWAWKPQDRPRSEQRLGERMYTTACLLWTALHDHYVGTQLNERYPNWSAVAHYYSMVHALRLLWFVLYGSFPTGHSAMAKALTGASSARADWGPDTIPARDEARISLAALQGAIGDGLGKPRLGGRLAGIGGAFAAAIKLREDSNYESLILAHQYFHQSKSPGFINVREEFARATTHMASANKVVLQFADCLLPAAFADDREWFCPRTEFQPGELMALVLSYLDVKIQTCHAGWGTSGNAVEEWVSNLPYLRARIAGGLALGNAARLTDYCRFANFEMKREILEDFRDKITSLERAVSSARASCEDEEAATSGS
jgi:hypothetical protein